MTRDSIPLGRYVFIEDRGTDYSTGGAFVVAVGAGVAADVRRFDKVWYYSDGRFAVWNGDGPQMWAIHEDSIVARERRTDE